MILFTFLKSSKLKKIAKAAQITAFIQLLDFSPVPLGGIGMTPFGKKWGYFSLNTFLSS